LLIYLFTKHLAAGWHDGTIGKLLDNPEESTRRKQMMRSFYNKLLFAIMLILLWCAATWIISGNYFNSRINEQIRQETELTHDRAQDLADSIRRNLNYLGGVPGFFIHAIRVNKALSLFGSSNIPSRLPLETKRTRWTADPVLKDLDQTLAIASANFHVDLIHVVNAAGDSIAASNWNTPNTTIGTNFAEREYFRMNQNGQRGQQYAVGKTTHIPGLFFSAPVVVNGKFMGAVVAKADVPNLTFLIRQTDSYVTDKNGVIILAHDKDKEMLSLAGSPVGKMSTAEKMAFYQKDEFPEMHITSWGNNEFPSLLNIQGEIFPQVIAVKELPEYGLTVYVEGDFPTFVDLNNERMLYFLFPATLGSLLILFAFGGLIHVRSINITRENLRESEKRFRILASGAFEGIAITSKGKFVDVNGQLTQMLGYKQNEMIGQPITDFIAPEDRDRVMANIRNGTESNVQLEILRKDGSRVTVEAHGQTIVQGGIPMRLTALRDITERKIFEAELKRQARIDHLTGVSNRGYFMIQAELELSRAIRYGKPLSLYMLDIDYFKKVNDSYGHKIGDLVLIKLAEVCRQTLREVDIIGRIGGEEFVILLPETDLVEATEVAERLKESIAKSKVPLEGGLPLHFTVSIGVTSLVSKDDNLDVLLNLADKALYQAKEQGRNRVCVVKQ
jgi:diguanylate cyclase (GGDEF)-like protein/PAS domain S-box-containing protein